jgi:hypothetical protein
MTTGTAEQKQELIEVQPINTRAAELATIEATTLLSEVKTIVIQSADDRKMVAEKYFNAARDAAKTLESERKKISVPLNAAIDALNALFKRPAGYLKEVRDTAESKLLAWDAKVQAEIDAENKRLREAAEKEEARKRAEKEAQERAWREKERKAKEDADRLAAEGKAEEAEKARVEAEKARAKADERAQQAAEVFVPAPVVVAEKIKVDGVKDVTRWDYEILDMNAIPDCFWVLDESKLAKYARDTKGTVPVAGVRFFPVKKLS